MPFPCATASASAICAPKRIVSLTDSFPRFKPRSQRFALHQFHHQVVRADIVQRADVGVADRRNRARLLLESVD